MNTPLFDTPRLLTAALLVGCLGLPMTACAQTEQVAEAQAVEAEPEADKTEKTDKAEQDAQAAEAAEAASDQAAQDSDQADASEDKQDEKDEKTPEKTPEQIAAEEAKKELDALKREAQLRSARLAAELAPLNEAKQRIEAEISLLRARQQEAEAELSDAQAKSQLEQKKADFQAQLDIAEITREIKVLQQQFQQKQVLMQIDALEKQLENEKLTADNAKLSAMASALQTELSYINTQRAAASVDKKPMQYPENPLNGKTLSISDRRIPLNGSITTGTSDYVTERIHYFNNLNEKAPIFIVIDRCPGGSVMEGYRIVTAMQNSKAPVHVVVKQYAASMAAVITTLAEESYAYPNAIILHHQMSSSMRGNLTQQKERLEEGFEWARRLADPVAEKMGVTYDEFTALMYKNNSDGDWAEFADKAVKLKWVNHVIQEIRETALVTAPVQPAAPRLIFMEDGSPMDPSNATNPGANAMPRPFAQHELFNTPIKLKTKTDGNGNTYTELPALGPYDFYFLHDPDGRYRIAK